jgi:hypothetical protein
MDGLNGRREDGVRVKGVVGACAGFIDTTFEGGQVVRHRTKASGKGVGFA